MVTTLSALSAGNGNATLRGELNPEGEAATAWFEWGTTTAYGNTTTMTSVGAGTSTMPFSANLSGLAANTVYHYRLVVSNQFGRLEGRDLFFNSTAPFNVYADIAGANPGNPAWGDFDNDGDLDLLYGGQQSQTVNVSRLYRFDGGATFTDTALGIPEYPYPRMQWGDVDADGRLDFLVAK